LVKEISSYKGNLKPIILATGEAEIRRIAARGQPGQIISEPHLEKNPSQTKKRTDGVAEVVERLASMRPCIQTPVLGTGGGSYL
jgi:hypothetical protein